MLNIQFFAWALVAVGVTGAGSYGLGYMRGRQADRHADRAEQLQAQVAELQQALAAEQAAAQAQQITRTVVLQHAESIHLETTHSIEVVRGMWLGPACAIPERVQSQLQARIDEANAAASQL